MPKQTKLRKSHVDALNVLEFYVVHFGIVLHLNKDIQDFIGNNLQKGRHTNSEAKSFIGHLLEAERAPPLDGILSERKVSLADEDLRQIGIDFVIGGTYNIAV